MGAVAWAIRQRSVSHPRSSNRTCRSPASGSPTGFTVRHTEKNSDRKRRLRGQFSPPSEVVDPGVYRWHASTDQHADGKVTDHIDERSDWPCPLEGTLSVHPPAPPVRGQSR